MNTLFSCRKRSGCILFFFVCLPCTHLFSRLLLAVATQWRRISRVSTSLKCLLLLSSQQAKRQGFIDRQSANSRPPWTRVFPWRRGIGKPREGCLCFFSRQMYVRVRCEEHHAMLFCSEAWCKLGGASACTFLDKNAGSHVGVAHGVFHEAA